MHISAKIKASANLADRSLKQQIPVMAVSAESLNIVISFGQ